MNNKTILAAALAITLGLASSVAGAAGGKNAYSNPTGEPDDGTAPSAPYMSLGGGENQVYCDDENPAPTPMPGKRELISPVCVALPD
jgi:hypothetical protein